MFFKLISLSQERRGLSNQLDDLLARQKTNGHILPGQVLTKAVKIEGKTAYAAYSEPRDFRSFSPAEQKHLDIAMPAPPPFYEYTMKTPSRYVNIINEWVYRTLSPAEKKYFQRAWLLKEEQETLNVVLSGCKNNTQEFRIGANFAPFGKDHLIIWAAPKFFESQIVSLKQTYQGLNFLYWTADLLEQVNDPEYRFFYNAKGTGNSSDILHFQGMREKFPAFAYLSYAYPTQTSSNIIFTSRKAWPFKGILARFTSENKETVLTELTMHIKAWLGKDPRNTFNLLAQRREFDGKSLDEIFFIKRKAGLFFIKGMSNEFSGAEVGGRIGLPSRKDYENFQDIDRLSWDDNRLP